MSRSRRDFLKAVLGASAAGLSSVVSSQWVQASAGSDYLAIGDGVEEPPQGNPYQDIQSQPGRVQFLELTKPKSELIEIGVPFRPHGITQSPKRDTQFAAFEKWGKHAALFDLGNREPPILLKDPEGRFFGHGVFDRSGEKVFAAVYKDLRARGFVSVFSAADGKKIAEYDSGGAFPHDCQLDASGRIMVVHRRGRLKNQDQENSLSWLDSQTGKVVERLVFPRYGEGVLYHFRQFEDGWIVASGAAERESAKKPGIVLAISPSSLGAKERRRFQQLAPETKGLLGESLSLEEFRVSGRSVVVVTNPVANMFHFWDFRKNELLSSQSLESCRGVRALENQLLISSGFSKSLWTRTAESEALKEMKELTGRFGNGSHLYSFRIKGPIKRRV